MGQTHQIIQKQLINAFEKIKSVFWKKIKIISFFFKLFRSFQKLSNFFQKR